MDLKFEDTETGSHIDTLWLHKHQRRLTYIFTPRQNRGKGSASRLLAHVCAQADRDDIHLELYVLPTDLECGLNEDQLIKWYQKFFFKFADSDKPGIFMTRTPRIARRRGPTAIGSDNNMAKIANSLIRKLDELGHHLIDIKYDYKEDEWVIQIQADTGSPKIKSYRGRTFSRPVAQIIVELQRKEDEHSKHESVEA